MDVDGAPAPNEGNGGRRFRRLRKDMPTRSLILGTALALLAILVLLPMLMLAYGSFRTAAPGRPGFLTLSNYSILASPEIRAVVVNSLTIGVGSTLVSVSIGLLLALIIVRTNVLAPRLLDSIVLVPAYMAPFIGAVAWTLLLSPEIGYINRVLSLIDLPILNIYSMGGIIWVIGLYYAPIAYLYIRPALVNFDPALEEAARVTGASNGAALRRVVLPLAVPAILSATLVVFVNALGQFGIPGVLGRQVGIDVVPTLLVRLVRTFPADPNGAAVLGLALTAVTVVGLWINNRIIRKHDYVTVAGRASAQVVSDVGRWRYLFTAACFGYVALAIVLPLAAMLVASLQPFLSPQSWSVGWTLDNYRFALSFPSLARSIQNSVVLSLGAAIAGTALAVLLSYFLSRTKSVANTWIEQVAATPLAVPHTVFGLSLLWMWISIPVRGIYGSRWILLIAYIALFFPYAMRSTNAAFAQLDTSLEDAGRVLGASWLRTLRRIVVPLLRPGLISGATIILYHSIRELSASILLISPGNEVMAVAIWDLFGEGQFVELFALSILNVAMVFFIVAVANVFGGSLRR